MKVLTKRLLGNCPVLKFLKFREANQRWRSENVSPKIKPMRSWASRAICRVLSSEEKRAGLWTRAVVIEAMIFYIDVWSIRLACIYNRHKVWVIDQVWGQDDWILAKFFFCVFMDRDEVKVHKHAKKIEANIQPSWPHKLGQQRIYNMVFGKFFLLDTVGNPERARCRLHLARSGSQSHCAIWIILPARGASHIIINNYSPKWRWIVVDIHRAAKRRSKYPPLSPTLRWIIVLVYTRQVE